MRIGTRSLNGRVDTLTGRLDVVITRLENIAIREDTIKIGEMDKKISGAGGRKELHELVGAAGEGEEFVGE